MSARAPQRHQVDEEVPDVEQGADRGVTVTSRITVGLIPSAWTALQRLMSRTRLNRTDVINRAIAVYALVEEHTGNGEELVFRNPETGREVLVQIV